MEAMLRISALALTVSDTLTLENLTLNMWVKVTEDKVPCDGFCIVNDSKQTVALERVVSWYS